MNIEKAIILAAGLAALYMAWRAYRSDQAAQGDSVASNLGDQRGTVEPPRTIWV